MRNSTVITTEQNVPKFHLVFSQKIAFDEILLLFRIQSVNGNVFSFPHSLSLAPSPLFSFAHCVHCVCLTFRFCRRRKTFMYNIFRKYFCFGFCSTCVITFFSFISILYGVWTVNVSRCLSYFQNDRLSLFSREFFFLALCKLCTDTHHRIVSNFLLLLQF